MTRPPADEAYADKPAKAPAKRGANPGREAREAAALRANLLKRKDQARKRETPKVKPDGPTD